MNKNKKKFHVIRNNIIYKIILFLVFSLIVLFVLLFLYFFYQKNISPLPDVRGYSSIPMPESTIIYDKDGGELYKIYSEKRTYVDYEEINKNMINAIVAGEDKRFWTNPGYDLIGITRAIIAGVFNGGEFSGTSGITQQLAKITYLTNERTIVRKVKELYLSVELNSIFDKKDILELYLNKIFFGGNSYGVEQASETFFGKTALELSVLESSILASLPKAPSGLSPYKYKAKLIGSPLVINSDGIKLKILSNDAKEKKKVEIDLLIDFINNLNASTKGNYLEICGIEDSGFFLGQFNVNDLGCTNIKFNKLLLFLNSISIDFNGDIISYNTGRKDYILSRMLEDEYITFDQFKNAIIGSFGFEFKKYSDEIRYPHFVMYVKSYLDNKYGEETIKTGGFKVFTSIDPELQDKAQELIERQIDRNIEKYNARNAALISLDNKTGEILSMIGGVNYFDEENGGYNNMTLARLQPGSSFKPFVYLLAMIKKGFTKDTIFTDEKFTFPGDYIPNNADDKYMGKMTLSKALNYSRNIPAVKVYYAAGEEYEIIKFLKDFGIESLEDFKKEYKNKYGYEYVYAAPMALGTVQITPMELAGAYSVLGNNGIKNEIKSITTILDSDGNIIENNNKNQGIKVLDMGITYKMNSILSNGKDRPDIWNYFLTIPNLPLAAKGGTSSKQYKKDKDDKEDTIFPKDMWTVGYTPQITTVVWAGNTSGEELKGDAFGINGAGLIMRDYMDFAHKDLEIEEWLK